MALCASADRAGRKPDYSFRSLVAAGLQQSIITTGNGHKFVVIHDMEGYYLASVSYLNRCDTDTNGNYNVSASIHYGVNGWQDGLDEDGTVTIPSMTHPWATSLNVSATRIMRGTRSV